MILLDKRRNDLLVALLLVVWSTGAEAHNGAVAIATQVSGLRVDGDLGDWPVDAQWYPIALFSYGDVLDSKADLQAWFHVGYDPGEHAVYVAVEVEDESLVLGTGSRVSWNDGDGSEAYLEVAHDAAGPSMQYWVRSIAETDNVR